jgi:hypothetical protein
MEITAAAVLGNKVEAMLEGQPVQPVFRRA